MPGWNGQKHHAARGHLVYTLKEMTVFPPEVATVSMIKNKSATNDVFYPADLGPIWVPGSGGRRGRRGGGGTPTLPPWPVDGTRWGSNLSAMAAKRGAEVSKATCFTARANGDHPINTCQM